MANVLDRKENDNIMPFGECLSTHQPCMYLMGLATKWDNIVPQKATVNGEQVITTDSVLWCIRRKSASHYLMLLLKTKQPILIF